MRGARWSHGYPMPMKNSVIVLLRVYVKSNLKTISHVSRYCIDHVYSKIVSSLNNGLKWWNRLRSHHYNIKYEAHIHVIHEFRRAIMWKWMEIEAFCISSVMIPQHTPLHKFEHDFRYFSPKYTAKMVYLGKTSVEWLHMLALHTLYLHSASHQQQYSKSDTLIL